MSDFKVSGCCTWCDEECFEVLTRWQEGERYPGEPRRLGPPLSGATRVTFLLIDGSRADMTFCGKCVNDISPQKYTAIWRKVIRSWGREMRETPDTPGRTQWFRSQFENGILGEMGRILWSECNG
jgi:hypothetical protein